jgi:gamma-butyrobetaine dioxygenase
VTGGESIFVDSFRAAETLHKEDPAAFKTLSETDVKFWYINDGHHLHHNHKTIVVDGFLPDGRPKVTYVNYSPPFQAPLPLHTAKEFYPALQKFAALLRNPSSRWEYLMKESDLVFFDNRRVLHARRAFSATGAGDSREPNRWLKGCYVEADPIWDRLRVLSTNVLP